MILKMVFGRQGRPAGRPYSKAARFCSCI